MIKFVIFCAIHEREYDESDRKKLKTRAHV